MQRHDIYLYKKKNDRFIFIQARYVYIFNTSSVRSFRSLLIYNSYTVDIESTRNQDGCEKSREYHTGRLGKWKDESSGVLSFNLIVASRASKPTFTGVPQW